MYGFLIFNAILQKLIAINLCELQPRLREYALTRLSGDTKPMLPISRLWLMEYMIFNYVDVMKQIPQKTWTYDYHENNNNMNSFYAFLIQCKNMICNVNICWYFARFKMRFLYTHVTINKLIFLLSNSWWLCWWRKVGWLLRLNISNNQNWKKDNN